MIPTVRDVLLPVGCLWTMIRTSVIGNTQSRILGTGIRRRLGVKLEGLSRSEIWFGRLLYCWVLFPILKHSSLVYAVRASPSLLCAQFHWFEHRQRELLVTNSINQGFYHPFSCDESWSLNVVVHLDKSILFIHLSRNYHYLK